MNGFLLINKHVGPTSHDIVDRIRRLTNIKTVGHAGTLDPFAEGLLVVGVGREATREFSRLIGLDKRYVATLRLGAVSDTDDRTGRIAIQDFPPQAGSALGMTRIKIQESDVKAVLKIFTGKIMQIPPMYSAKKIKGKKLYELAREGKTIERLPVPIEIYSIEIEAKPRGAEASPRGLLTLAIHCSSGTYIRALARDIGEELKTGAYLEELKRTAIGPFTIEESVKVDDLTPDNWTGFLYSTDKLLSLLAV